MFPHTGPATASGSRGEADKGPREFKTAFEFWLKAMGLHTVAVASEE